ncbi:MAG: T9SS type A sorting domain-containing protein [Bacteroidota bacterium]
MTKRLLLMFALAVTTRTLFAQPILQGNVVPNVGVVVYNASADTNSVQPGNPGANLTWNFSSLVPLSQPPVTRYLAPAGTPYASSFPTANLVTKVGDADTALYAYARKEANQYVLLGFRSNQYVVDYSNPDAQLKYPTNYNGTYNETFAYTTDAGTGFPFTSTGSRTIKYDAYGTLTTPLGTFPNAMRIKAITVQTDSSSFFGNELINHTDILTYDWLAPNQPGAIISVSYIHTISETRFPGIDTIITESAVTKSVNFISTGTTSAFTAPDAPKGLVLSALGPNPATDQLRLAFSMETGGRMLNCFITDASGRVMQSQQLEPQAGENEFVIPVDRLAAGVYQLTLMDGAQLLTKSWVKE